MIAPLPWLSNSGRSFASGSSSRSLPCSTRIMTDVAVATGLVSEARSKTVSRVIGSSAGSTPATPRTATYAILPAPADEHDRPRDLLLGDRPVDRVVDPSARRGRSKPELARARPRARPVAGSAVASDQDDRVARLIMGGLPREPSAASELRGPDAARTTDGTTVDEPTRAIPGIGDRRPERGGRDRRDAPRSSRPTPPLADTSFVRSPSRNRPSRIPVTNDAIARALSTTDCLSPIAPSATPIWTTPQKAVMHLRDIGSKAPVAHVREQRPDRGR